MERGSGRQSSPTAGWTSGEGGGRLEDGEGEWSAVRVD